MKSKPELWIGLAEFKRLNREAYGAAGAFTNVITWPSVSMDDDGWKSVKPFIEEQKMNYAVLIGNDALAKLYASTRFS
jgi:hypothetical protein